jgi:hypothetical protein
MTTGHLLAKALVAGSMLTAGCPVFAADVTPERLVQRRQGAPELADEPSHLRCSAVLATLATRQNQQN